MVELATFVTPLAIHWASSQSVFLSTVFTSSHIEVFVVGLFSVYVTYFCMIASMFLFHSVSCKLHIAAVWAL